jgi:transcriptional regulator with XRE-family HTH domain
MNYEIADIVEKRGNPVFLDGIRRSELIRKLYSEGMRPKQIAMKFGVSPSYISIITRDLRNPPKTAVKNERPIDKTTEGTSPEVKNERPIDKTTEGTSSEVKNERTTDETPEGTTPEDELL